MNQKNLFSRAGLALLAVAFIALMMVSSMLMRGWRVDLTENGLFTLSDGSINIVKNIEEPINLYLFFSESSAKDIPSLKSYAQRVRELLQEYARLSNGKLVLKFIDPVPFSEDEDRAAEYGLQAVPVAGEKLYFGIVGSNSVDVREILPFLQPDKESQLEYDISRLIAKLNQNKPPVLGLISGLPVNGGYDMMSQQPRQPWVVFDQLKQLYTVRDIQGDSSELPDDLSLLVLVQPKSLSPALKAAVDQYVMKGGNLIVFTDPYAESDRIPASQENPFPQVLPGTDLNDLFKGWGVKVAMDQIVADSDNALQVSAGRGQAPARHLGILALSGAKDGSDVISANLELVHFGMAGHIESLEGATTTVTPIFQSSLNSALLPRSQFEFLPDPSSLAKNFVAAGNPLTVAAKINGKAKASFPAAEGQKDYLAESVDSGIHVLLVADTDVLTDRYWVQLQEFFGQRVAQPFADNGNFIFNAVEQFSGSSDLINLRSRGQFSRPFSKVEQLRREAETSFYQREEELQKRLQETEQKLSDLEKRMNQSGTVQINAEEANALAEFQQERVRVRKALRDVQHQLNQDIEALGRKLKILNIVVVPLVLMLLALFIALSRRQRRAKRALV